jgi:Zn-dependent protease with chaperone function
MNKTKRVTLATLFYIILATFTLAIYGWGFFKFTDAKSAILTILYLGLTGLLCNDVYVWIKRGKRGESFDLIVLGFLFVIVYLLTDDIMNSFIGALSIYMIFGVMELKDYEVLNKILIITVVTYNFIFFAGLINSIMKANGLIATDVIRDTAFSFSIWIMLGLGFALFGRKYIVVFRFMSPNYLTLFLFIIAWMAVRFIGRWVDITNLIYLFLIITNWLVYFISGPVLDFMLGIKRTDNPELIQMVSEIQDKIGLKGKIKVGFGKYPILNAMAYGATFDKRIAIIAEDINTIPKDELKGIIAHELNHTKGGIKKIPDTFMLSIISTIEIVAFWFLGWPVTYYDYVFNPEAQPFPIWVFILLNLMISVIIYVFIRVLEAYADINTKKAGLGQELAKGLYNLEGFYSSGREIGLDTMLLCDEKITEYNRISNYANTAEYLNDAMVYPSRLTLLSNLLNSHPPSYHRILSMYGELGPWKESFLPFSLLSKKKRKKFALESWKSRITYEKMANNKFKEMFGINDYTEYLNKQNKKDYYRIQIGKSYIYIDKYNLKIGYGILKDVKFNNDISAPVEYVLTPIHLKDLSLDDKHSKSDVSKFYQKGKILIFDALKITNLQTENISLITTSVGSNNSIYLDPLNTKLINVEMDGRYIRDKETEFQLLSLHLPNFDNSKTTNLLEQIKNYQEERAGSNTTNNSLQNLIKLYFAELERFEKLIRSEAHYVFLNSYYTDDEQKESVSTLDIVAQPISKFKIPFNIALINKSMDKEIFIEEKGTLKISKLKYYTTGSNILESQITCSKVDVKNEGKIEETNYKLKDIIIKKDEFAFLFHNDESTRVYEEELLDYLINKKIRTTIYLKKAVNNQETGQILNYTIDKTDPKNKSILKIRNMQGKDVDFPFNKIEVLVFAEKTISILEKQKMSVGEKLIQKWIKWRNPHQIFNL